MYSCGTVSCRARRPHEAEPRRRVLHRAVSERERQKSPLPPLAVTASSTPEEARQQALGLLADVSRGADPAERRAADRAAMTVAGIMPRILREGGARADLLKEGAGARSRNALHRSGPDRAPHHPANRKSRGQGLEAVRRSAIPSGRGCGKTATDVRTKKRGPRYRVSGAGTGAPNSWIARRYSQPTVGEGYRADNPVSGVERPAYKRRRVNQRRKSRCQSGAGA